MDTYPDLDRPPALGYIPDPDNSLKIFCIKLCGEELQHFLPATEMQEDYYGNMEVFRGAERIAWYSQPLVEYWAFEEIDYYLNPCWRADHPTLGESIQEMIRGEAPIGADESGGLWYDISPNRS